MNNKEIAISWAAAAALASPKTVAEWARWIWAIWTAAIEKTWEAVNNILNYAWIPNIWSWVAMPLAAGWWAWMVSQWWLNKLNIENGWIRKPVIAASILTAATSPMAPYFTALTLWKYWYEWGKFAIKWLWKGLWKVWDWWKPANNTNFKKEKAA